MEPDETHIARLETLFKTLDADKLNEIHSDVKKYVDENKHHLDAATKTKLNKIIGGVSSNYLKPIGFALATALLFVAAWWVAKMYSRRKKITEILEGLGVPDKILTKKQEDGIILDTRPLESEMFSSKYRHIIEYGLFDIIVTHRKQEDKFTNDIVYFINKNTDKIARVRNVECLHLIAVADFWQNNFIKNDEVKDKYLKWASPGERDPAHLVAVILPPYPEPEKITDKIYEDIEWVKNQFPHILFIDFMKFRGDICQELLKPEYKYFIDFINKLE